MLTRMLVFGASLGLLAALAPDDAIAQKRGGTVVLAQQAQPPTLDAAVTSSEATRNFATHVFEGLFTRDEQAGVIPQLAEGYRFADDGLSVVITVRSGIKFHNGKDMTADDVRASLLRYGKIGASAKIMDVVTDVQAVDRHTVKVSFSRPAPIFIEQLSSPRGPVVVIPAEEGMKPASQVAVVGTGPYKFINFAPDSQLTLERFDGYVADGRFVGPSGFGGKRTAYLDKIAIRFVPEAGVRAAGLEAGEFQAVDNLTASSGRRLESNAQVSVFKVMPWAIQTLFLNAGLPPTDNQKFRQAIQAGLGMEEIMAIASDGLYRLSWGWQYPEGVYFAGDVGKELYNQHDQAKARRLLQESGYAEQELTFLTDSAFKNNLDAAVVAAGQLRALGINVTLKTLDWPSTVRTRNSETGWNMVPNAVGTEPWEGPYGVAILFAESNIHKKKDPELEELYRKLVSAPAMETRKALFADIQKQIYEKVYAIKVGDLGQYVAVHSKLKGYKPYRMPRFWDVWYE
ncbi:MAG: ABC transporter substrate-binding protein [Alphaproteobacteria bacterium]|nr:ABC transporter substrate-binding protein [Alphaproteobacteria bacterium]